MSAQHIDWWALAAWCGINLVIPIIAPLVVLWLFSKPSTTSAMAGRNVLKSIGKGELFWAAMGMSAATCYELYSLQEILTDPNHRGVAWLVFWIHLGVILFSVIFVGIGSLGTAPSGSTNPHIPDPVVFRASILTLVFVVFTYTISHTFLTAQQAKLQAEASQKTKDDKQAIIEKLKNCLAKVKINALRCTEEIE